ncbi:MAG TPA: signal peptidase I [Vicinamibacterales bacterium]|nr:signal peptidase I [Vicinamibacterales bacterium]
MQLNARSFIVGAAAALLLVSVGESVYHAHVDGNSMEPTYKDGDHVLIDKLTYRFRQPSRTEAVAFYYPINPDRSFIGRVIAREGDTIKIADGKVFVNNQELPEPYVSATFRGKDNYGPKTVPEGTYFIMGDRRDSVSDSRHWGPVPRKYVWGRVFATIWHDR